jgi:hypothetical protein
MLFKSVNHFSSMADAFDHFLNDAVYLHIQVVDHHQNLAGAGIRQRSVTVAGIQSAQIPATRTAEFRPSGRDLAKTARFRPKRLASNHLRQNLANPDFDETLQISTFIAGIRQ